MKHKLILLSLLLPYLASAQVAKDTVTVLSPAQITAASPNDTANIYFVIANAWRKANFDSIARYTRVKLIGDRGDITVSGATGLTWTIDDGAVTAAKLATSAVDLTATTVTGTLPVNKGGTGQSSLAANKVLVGNGTGGVLQPTNLHWDNMNSRLGVGTAEPTFADGLGLNIYNGAGSARLKLNNNTTGSLSSDGVEYTLAGSDLYIINNEQVGNIFFFSNSLNGMRITSAGEAWIGYTTDNGEYRLQVADSVYVGGNVSASAYTTRSDYELKENIQDVAYGIREVMQLQPVKYTYKSNGAEQLGFIAQDLGVILPEVVSFEEKMSVFYSSLIPVLTKAIQEQQTQIEALKARITQLENK